MGTQKLYNFYVITFILKVFHLWGYEAVIAIVLMYTTIL